MSWLRFDSNPTQFRESVYTRLATNPAVPRVLDSAERHLRLIMHCRPIDMANTGFDLLRHSQSAGDVLGKDRRRQAVLGLIGQGDRMLLITRAHDPHYGPKAF